MISPAVVTATSSGTERYGLQVSALQDNIRIENNAITGNLKLVEQYPQFGDKEASKPGHYLALTVEVPEGATVTTKIEGGTNPDYVDLTMDKFCVYRIKDTSQKIKIKTKKDSMEVEKTYALTGLVLDELVGESAFDASKTDYGGFGKNTDFYQDGSVEKVWAGTNCTVTGTFNWVKKDDVAPKLPSDGNYFAFKLADYYKGRPITVQIGGGAEKTVADTDWVCKVDDDKKTIVVKVGTTVIATFNLDGATFTPAD